MATISSSKSSVMNCQSPRRHIAFITFNTQCVRQSIKPTNNWRASTLHILTFRFLGKTCADTLSSRLYALYCQLLTFFCSGEFLCFNWPFFCADAPKTLFGLWTTHENVRRVLYYAERVLNEETPPARDSLQINCVLNSTFSPLVRTQV
jgi:hypothetical protein